MKAFGLAACMTKAGLLLPAWTQLLYAALIDHMSIPLTPCPPLSLLCCYNFAADEQVPTLDARLQS
jgi:hypothetical protein